METDSRLLWLTEVMPPLSAAMWTCWSFNNSWSQRQPSGAQLILLMHFSQSLWQPSVGHSLLSLGEVSDAPGTDCPGVEALPEGWGGGCEVWWGERASAHSGLVLGTGRDRLLLRTAWPIQLICASPLN